MCTMESPGKRTSSRTFNIGRLPQRGKRDLTQSMVWSPGLAGRRKPQPARRSALACFQRLKPTWVEQRIRGITDKYGGESDEFARLKSSTRISYWACRRAK